MPRIIAKRARRSSVRAEKRNLIRQIDAAARARFGRHASFRIYCDTCDSDPSCFHACLQHVRRPANARDDLMFPVEGRGITARTDVAALGELLAAIEGSRKHNASPRAATPMPRIIAKRTRRHGRPTRGVAAKPNGATWWKNAKLMAESGRRTARRAWRPDGSYDETAVFQAIMAEVLDDVGYEPGSRGAQRLYERVNLAVTPFTRAYEQEWRRADEALDARSGVIGREQALREADAIVEKRRTQRSATRAAVNAGHHIALDVEDAMNAADFWLTSQGGNIYSYERKSPGGTREYIVSQRDNNPPESLAEAVVFVRQGANGDVRETNFTSLRRALVPQRRKSLAKHNSKPDHRRRRLIPPGAIPVSTTDYLVARNPKTGEVLRLATQEEVDIYMAQPVRNRHLYNTPLLLSSQLRPVLLSPDILLDEESMFAGLPSHLYGDD